MMESCIYPFERFERLKKWKVIHLLIHLVIHLSYYKNEMF